MFTNRCNECGRAVSITPEEVGIACNYTEDGETHCPGSIHPHLETALLLEPVTIERAIECGLRQGWVEAETDEARVEVTVGAGLGSPWMTVTITDKGNGAKTYYRWNVTKLMEQIFDAIQ